MPGATSSASATSSGAGSVRRLEDRRPRLEPVPLDLAAERVEPADRVLEARRGDVGPEAAADLERAQRDQAAERLPDRGPADAVALHQLELGLDLRPGRQLAGPDPVAQVRLDAAVERESVHVGHGQPLIPVMVIPRTNCRWAITNSTIIGITLTSAPAISSGQRPTYCPWNSDSPAVTVRVSMSRR